MKAILTASTLATASLILLSACYTPGGPPPPASGRGPRGYTLDKPPGRYGTQDETPGGPGDTRYLDPSDPSAVQQPAPGAPPLPGGDTPPPSSTPPSTGPAAPIVVTPPGTTTPAAPTPPAPAPAPTGMPTATKTKPGFVKSPFDSLGREIDVREMRSGQKARCPYTQKVFLVP